MYRIRIFFFKDLVEFGSFIKIRIGPDTDPKYFKLYVVLIEIKVRKTNYYKTVSLEKMIMKNTL